MDGSSRNHCPEIPETSLPLVSLWFDTLDHWSERWSGRLPYLELSYCKYGQRTTWRRGEHFHWQRTENGPNSGNHWKRGEKNASSMYWMYRVMKSEPQTSSLKEHFKRRTFDMYMVRPGRLWEHPVLFIVSTCTSPSAHRGDCRYPSSCSFVLILDVQFKVVVIPWTLQSQHWRYI